MRIGILTAGGDCPGINAAIRGVGKSAIVEHKMEVIGFSSGFTGIINKEYQELKEDHLSGILTLGGTILGTSREKPFKQNLGMDKSINKPDMIKKNSHELGLDCLVCIGGNGTQTTANLLAQEGLNIIGIPKTIDNDIEGTDQTFGFDSALGIATEAIDRLHTTANSHKRIMVIELMGHNAGWLSLYAGVAGGGDVILIPEIAFKEEYILRYIEKRVRNKKRYSIVVVAEGIPRPNKKSAAQYISDLISKNTGYESRQTILGYIQRGGTPSAADRILATRFGNFATLLISQGNFGNMIAIRGNKMHAVPLSEVGGKKKLVPIDYPMIKGARKMDTCFGDK
ncbi:MAG: 6-phosphofructokinase [Bacteroidetes bacterium]|nr:6-phosphofructokinase [Bacteroidota bacterium]